MKDAGSGRRSVPVKGQNAPRKRPDPRIQIPHPFGLPYGGNQSAGIAIVTILRPMRIARNSYLISI